MSDIDFAHRIAARWNSLPRRTFNSINYVLSRETITAENSRSRKGISRISTFFSIYAYRNCLEMHCSELEIARQNSFVHSHPRDVAKRNGGRRSRDRVIHDPVARELGKVCQSARERIRADIANLAQQTTYRVVYRVEIFRSERACAHFLPPSAPPSSLPWRRVFLSANTTARIRPPVVYRRSYGRSW